MGLEGKEDSVEHSVSQSSRAVGGVWTLSLVGGKTTHAMQNVRETELGILKAGK